MPAWLHQVIFNSNISYDDTLSFQLTVDDLNQTIS